LQFRAGRVMKFDILVVPSLTWLGHTEEFTKSIVAIFSSGHCSRHTATCRHVIILESGWWWRHVHPWRSVPRGILASGDFGSKRVHRVKSPNCWVFQILRPVREFLLPEQLKWIYEASSRVTCSCVKRSNVNQTTPQRSSQLSQGRGTFSLAIPVIWLCRTEQSWVVGVTILASSQLSEELRRPDQIFQT